MTETEGQTDRRGTIHGM